MFTPHVQALHTVYVQRKSYLLVRDELKANAKMPLIKSLRKVTKKLSNQLAGSLHVKGRKFKQLNRATEREHKLKIRKLQFAEQKNHELLFYLHFQEKINEEPEKEVFTLEDMRSFVHEYVCRNDEELESIAKLRRPGRPLTSKQQLQVEKKKHEEQLFKTGWKSPDLSDKLTVERLRTWNGTSGSVNAWKFTFVTKDGSSENEVDSNAMEE